MCRGGKRQREPTPTHKDQLAKSASPLSSGSSKVLRRLLHYRRNRYKKKPKNTGTHSRSKQGCDAEVHRKESHREHSVGERAVYAEGGPRGPDEFQGGEIHVNRGGSQRAKGGNTPSNTKPKWVRRKKKKKNKKKHKKKRGAVFGSGKKKREKVLCLTKAKLKSGGQKQAKYRISFTSTNGEPETAYEGGTLPRKKRANVEY